MAATGAYFPPAVSSPLFRHSPSLLLGKLNSARIQSMIPRFAISIDRVPSTFVEAEKGITAEVKQEEGSVVAETVKRMEQNEEKKQRSGWKDYLEQAEELIVADGGPPRWFSPLECGSRLDKSPLMLFLPGIDGLGLGLVSHHEKLGRIFDLWCLHIPVADRTPFTDLVKLVEKTVRSEYQRSPNRPIYLVGESLGGCLALAVAARNRDIDLVLILANPGTSFSRSQLQLVTPLLEALPSSLSPALPNILSLTAGKIDTSGGKSKAVRNFTVSSLFGGAAVYAVPGRVRVAVRLRPRNAEEEMADADFGDCVELQPELKRLKLRRNNWDSDTFEFDEVLTQSASQKRVYEVVAKPVVESVLDGYNGTVMAYGQTGTGKTFTLGQLGEGDTSSRGIMVRSMEDILADLSPDTDSVTVSYLQLYMETLQDLLNPANDNIPIVEDPRTGDVSLPGATLVDIRDQQSFLELLRIGEANRVAANTKMNTESSRSHAMLTVHIKRSVAESEDIVSSQNGDVSHLIKPSKPLVRKSKLVVVDLAGSERVHKSGSEGLMLEEAKSINLSLSSLGKCINALAENNAHVPFRDSKLTRMLRDSFGGTARTSLIVTIGPSPRHRGETSSTILFGQRAMKVENMLKIKEEFDYKSLSRKLEIQLDKLIAENERQQKAFEDDIEKINLEAQCRIIEAERKFANELEKEKLKCQMEYMGIVKELEQKLVLNQDKHDCHADNGEGPAQSSADEVAELKMLVETESSRRKAAEEEITRLKWQLEKYTKSDEGGFLEITKLHNLLEDEAHQKKKLEEEIIILRSQLLQSNYEMEQMRRCLEGGSSGSTFSATDSSVTQVRHSQFKDAANGQKSSVATLFEQVGLEKILSLLESDDANVRIHAVKVVANLAAEEANQKRIVEAGGLTSLLMLLRRYEDETVRRVAAGAIANLAMNEANQELIMAEGGITLLSMAASDAEDPQTLRMVAGAIANLCGNDKILMTLRSQGGIKALLGIVRCGHPDVLSQVARGIANFAKCESRASNQGIKTGRSILIEDGALPWIVQNANNEAAPIRRHIELALCHLAQHEANAKDMISGGALWELVRISSDCSREDIRSLARKTLSSITAFKSELRRLRIDY